MRVHCPPLECKRPFPWRGFLQERTNTYKFALLNRIEFLISARVWTDLLREIFFRQRPRSSLRTKGRKDGAGLNALLFFDNDIAFM